MILLSTSIRINGHQSSKTMMPNPMARRQPMAEPQFVDIRFGPFRAKPLWLVVRSHVIHAREAVPACFYLVFDHGLLWWMSLWIHYPITRSLFCSWNTTAHFVHFCMQEVVGVCDIIGGWRMDQWMANGWIYVFHIVCINHVELKNN